MVILDVLVICQAMLRVDSQLPGKVCGGAVEFLVKKVAPAPDGLSKRQARCTDVSPLSKVQFVPMGIKIQDDHPPDHSARNTESTLPDCERIQGMSEIPTRSDSRRWRRGQNVPEPRSNDPTNQQIGKEIPNNFRLIAAAFGFPCRQPGACHSAKHEDDAIEPDEQRTQRESFGHSKSPDSSSFDAPDYERTIYAVKR